MFKVIDSLLFELRPSFSREASFAWFVIIVVGLIVRFRSLRCHQLYPLAFSRSPVLWPDASLLQDQLLEREGAHGAVDRSGHKPLSRS